jgi:hypothetical protein
MDSRPIPQLDQARYASQNHKLKRLLSPQRPSPPNPPSSVALSPNRSTDGHPPRSMHSCSRRLPSHRITQLSLAQPPPTPSPSTRLQSSRISPLPSLAFPCHNLNCLRMSWSGSLDRRDPNEDRSTSESGPSPGPGGVGWMAELEEEEGL